MIRGNQPYRIDGCFTDKSERFVFLHTYKCASISIRNALGMRGRYRKFDSKSRDATKICVVRDPVDRLISAYFHLFRLQDDGFRNQHPVHLTRRMEFFKEREKSLNGSFTLFLHALDGWNFFDAVTYPQVGFLWDREVSLEEVEVIMTVSRLDECFSHFVKRYGLNAILSKDNQSGTNSEDVEKLKRCIEVDEGKFDLIRKLYAEDFELYEAASERVAKTIGKQ